MAKLSIYHFFDTALVLTQSRSQKREQNKKRRRSAIRPLLADRVISGAYQSLVLKMRERDT